VQDDRTIAAEFEVLLSPWSDRSEHFSGPVAEEEIVLAEQELAVVFPRSYRVFLRQFGSGVYCYYRILGIRNDRFLGDVVTMNRLTIPLGPRRFVRITDTIGGYAFYLDTLRMDETGEYPVVVFGPGASGRKVAASFLEFLRKLGDNLGVPRNEARECPWPAGR
jgi:hypothetical protein